MIVFSIVSYLRLVSVCTWTDAVSKNTEEKGEKRVSYLMSAFSAVAAFHLI